MGLRSVSFTWKHGALLAAIGTAGTAVHHYYVDADGGGSVLAYVQKYDALQKAGEKVVIRGNCFSSCTMALGYSNVCIAPDAILGFHPAYVPFLFGYAHYVIDPPDTRLMVAHFPAKVRPLLIKHGAKFVEDVEKNRYITDPGGWMRPKLVYVKGSEFEGYACDGRMDINSDVAD